MKLLDWLARASAIAAGALMTLITLLTCLSVIGRETLGKTVPGDFELVGLATGAAIGLFMPLCQLHRGNIIVDVFTVRLPKKLNAALDRVGALVLGLSFALMAWRAAVGGLNSWVTHSGTMLLGVPEWTAYVTMTPAFALTAIIALYQTLFVFGNFRGGHGT